MATNVRYMFLGAACLALGFVIGALRYEPHAAPTVFLSCGPCMTEPSVQIRNAAVAECFAR